MNEPHLHAGFLNSTPNDLNIFFWTPALPVEKTLYVLIVFVTNLANKQREEVKWYTIDLSVVAGRCGQHSLSDSQLEQSALFKTMVQEVYIV